MIGSGDLLKISILGTPEADQEVRVDADGNASLNFIGSVHLAGFSVKRAQATIANKLSAGGFYTDPQVLVSFVARENVEVFPSDTLVVGKAGTVYVVGDVHKTGGFVIENGHMTVLQAIAMAEGTNPDAALNKAILIRNTPDSHQLIPLALRAILAGKAPDLPLQAEDILFIPRSVAKTVRKNVLPNPVYQYNVLPNPIYQYYDVPPPAPLDSPTPIYIR